jgi:hypothetical protein
VRFDIDSPLFPELFQTFYKTFMSAFVKGPADISRLPRQGIKIIGDYRQTWQPQSINDFMGP